MRVSPVLSFPFLSSRNPLFCDALDRHTSRTRESQNRLLVVVGVVSATMQVKPFNLSSDVFYTQAKKKKEHKAEAVTPSSAKSQSKRCRPSQETKKKKRTVQE